MSIVTGGLTWDGGASTAPYELQTARVFFDLAAGFYGFPSVRGADDIVPGLPGRVRRNRVDDVLILELRGWVRGAGATVTDRRADFHAAAAELMSELEPTRATPGVLTVLPPYLGVSVPFTIEAFPLPWLEGPEFPGMSFRRFSIELEAIGNPPRWIEGES